MPAKFFRTIRFRLTLWNTIVVLLASLLALFAVREAMRLTIENEARNLLQEELLELELAIKQLYPDQNQINAEFERKVLGHSRHKWFASLYDGDGNCIWQSSNFPHSNNNGKSEFVFEREPSFDQTKNILVVEKGVELQDRSQRLIVIGEPTEFIKNDVWQLTKIMLYIGSVLLFVAPVGGFLLARQATIPVRGIISTTQSLDPTHLDSRLTIRGTGDELDQISLEINSFVDQIARYFESQREFVANAAHELRSPITAIQTSVDVTLEKLRTTEEYQDQLETVSEQCQQLRHLVNQLLELAETDANSMENAFEPVNLGDLIQKSIEVFSGVADEKAIKIKSRLVPDAIIFGDASKLRQVVNNLIDNSLKFSPPNSEILVELINFEDLAQISISDSGPGVPEQHLERVFDRFFQVDPSRQRVERGGNGLGLSICKSIVQYHNGTIHARNGDVGLEITVEIEKSSKN